MSPSTVVPPETVHHRETRHVWNYRLHGGTQRLPHPLGGPSPSGVPGLRQRGAGHPEWRALFIRKRVGQVRALEEALAQESVTGVCGIGHTRWATHGPANTQNAHPHLGGRSKVAVVHNGVIENHALLRRKLEAEGVSFSSQTDTEVIAHLVARELDGHDDLFGAVQRVLPRLEGTYGLAVISPRCPGQVIGARLGSPLVVGLGDGGHFLASDPVAIAPTPRGSPICGMGRSCG